METTASPDAQPMAEAAASRPAKTRYQLKPRSLGECARLASVDGFTAYLREGGDVKGLIKRTQGLLAQVGITDFAFANLGLLHDPLNLFGSDGPAGLRGMLSRSDFRRQNFLIHNAAASDTPVLASEIETLLTNSPVRHPLFDRNRHIIRSLKAAGIDDLYCAGIDSAQLKGRCIFVAGAHRNADATGILAENRWTLLRLCRALDHLLWPRLGKRLTRAFIPKSPLRLLATLANNDVTLNQAAAMIGISISTANQQIAQAKQALNVSTIHRAVLKAVELGLIEAVPGNHHAEGESPLRRGDQNPE